MKSELLVAFASLLFASCNDSSTAISVDAAEDTLSAFDAGISEIQGREFVLCRGTSTKSVELHAYLPAEFVISGFVTDVADDASTFATDIASKECGKAIEGIPAFKVETEGGEIWTFIVGTSPTALGTTPFIPLRFLKGQSVSVLFRVTPTFGSAFGMVVRNKQGALLLAVDESGFNAGLKPSDVPELAVSRGQVFARTKFIGGVVDQSEVVFHGDTVVAVRPDLKSSVQINERPYTVGVGMSYDWVVVQMSDTSSHMAWFVASGSI